MEGNVRKEIAVMTSSGPDNVTVYGALLDAAVDREDAVSIVYEGEVWTFRELLQSVEGVAAYLKTVGIGFGDAFAVYAQNRPELIFCYYAAAKCGAIFVPINPNMTFREVDRIVAHSGVKLLLYDETVKDVLNCLLIAVQTARIDKIEINSQAVPTGDDHAVSGDTDFLLIYSSGSTGAPKAIVLDQAAQVKAPKALSAMWNVTARDITLVALPLGYLYGLSTASATGVQSGGQIVVLTRFHPRDVLQALVASRATIFHGVPTMYSMMLEYAEEQNVSYDLAHVRVMVSAGAPLTDELKTRFLHRFNKRLVNYYALTEATPLFSEHEEEHGTGKEGSAGRPAPGVSVKIVDDEGHESDQGVSGELYVRAPGMIKRYLNAPEATRSALVEGFFKTGDIGYQDKDGQLHILGRKKDVIIRGGANIVPSEVEEVLMVHAAVHEAAVIGVPDDVFGELPVAFIVKREEADVASEELRDHVAREVADFKVPAQFEFLRELPLGNTGKVDREKLKGMWKELLQ